MKTIELHSVDDLVRLLNEHPEIRYTITIDDTEQEGGSHAEEEGGDSHTGAAGV